MNIKKIRYKRKVKKKEEKVSEILKRTKESWLKETWTEWMKLIERKGIEKKWIIERKWKVRKKV